MGSQSKPPGKKGAMSTADILAAARAEKDGPKTASPPGIRRPAAPELPTPASTDGPQNSEAEKNRIRASLGCGIPFGLILLAVGGGSAVAGDSMILIVPLLGIGASAAIGSLWALRGCWNPTRAAVGASLGLAGVGLFLGMTLWGSQHQQLKKTFQPLEAEFKDVANLVEDAQGKVYPKHMFPMLLSAKGRVFLHSKPHAVLDMDAYWQLPASLRFGGPVGDVKTVVFLNWSYNKVGEYRNSGSNTLASAFTGSCQVTVVDRSSKLVVGRKTLTTDYKPPELRSLKKDWYGSQPSYEQIAEYILSLPAAE